MNEKINLQELTALLAEKANISKKEADIFLREFFGLLSESLISDNQIKVKNLGTFKLIQVEDRESVNVRTGERVLIPAHQKISFSPANLLSDTINEPFALFEPVELEDSEIEEIPAENMEDEEDDISDVDITPIPINENLKEDSEENYMENIIVDENKPVANIPETATEDNGQTEIVNIQSVGTPIIAGEDNNQIQISQPDENTNEGEIPAIVSVTPETKEEIQKYPVHPARIQRRRSNEKHKQKKKCGPWRAFFIAFLILGIICAGIFAYLWYSNMNFRKSVYSTVSTITTPSKKKSNVPIEDYTRKENPIDSTTVKKQTPVADSIHSDTISATKDIEKTEEVPVTEAKKSPSEPQKTQESKEAPISKKKTPEKEPLVQSKTHTLKSGERLTLLALREYGHKIFWVYIYEENKNELSNPDVVPVGTVLKIPPAQKYGINKNDSGSINKAKALAKGYESKK